jgi:hypothetical protein
MVGINHWSGSGLRISNISRSQSEQTLHTADHAPNGAADHRADRTCGLAPNRSTMLDAIWNALRSPRAELLARRPRTQTSSLTSRYNPFHCCGAGQMAGHVGICVTGIGTIFCGREFCRPIEVETASKEDLAIQLREGWILGCSPTITNQSRARASRYASKQTRTNSGLFNGIHVTPVSLTE